jgi:ribosome-binding ATPase YchF (GTP1/OBG family)
LRGFAEPSYPYDRPAPDPVADLQALLDEFQIADLGILEKRLDRLRRDVTKPSKTQDADKKELAILERVSKAMEEKGSLRELVLKPEEEAVVRPYGFLTRKTLLAVLSLPEGAPGVEESWLAGLARLGVTPVGIQAKIEAEISALAPEERAGFLKDYGIAESASARLIRAAYETLGLLSFFTMGEDEVRAWTVHRGDTAVIAAGKIHSDIAKGFVRAETISFEDFRLAGSLAEGRYKGTLKLEGKEYVMKDGDCVNFRFTPPGAKA